MIVCKLKFDAVSWLFIEENSWGEYFITQKDI